MPNGGGDNIGGLGQPGPWVREPPAQVEERRIEGRETSLRLPLWQAVALSFCVSVVFSLIPVVVVALGRTVFWLAVACFGLASLIWLHRIAARYHDLNATDSIAAVAVVCVMGGVAYACQRVLGMLSFRWSLLIVPVFVFFCSMAVCLTVSFGQELLQRSPFQEQALWNAIGEIITYRYKKPPKPSEPVFVHVKNGPNNGSNGKAVEISPADADLTPEQRDYLDLVEFLSTGHHADNFGREWWTGRQLSSGREVTDPLYRRWTGYLKQAGWMEADNSGTRLTAPLREVLEHVRAAG